MRRTTRSPTETGRRNRNPEVEAWFARLEHPQKQTMLAVREAILAADSRMSECIKWSTPTFVFNGNLASLQPNAKQFVSVMFHRGSEIPGSHPLLKGSGRLVRTMQFAGPVEVRACKAAIRTVVRAWCNLRVV
jgi:hypothetical protein